MKNEIERHFAFSILPFALLAHVAQLVEHVLGKDEVTRSIRVVGSSANSI